MALVSLGDDGRPDDLWRVEEHRTGLRVYHRRALVLEKASMDQVVHYLLEHDADPEALVRR